MGSNKLSGEVFIEKDDGTHSFYHSGNDGQGSNLDADLLDGQEGSWYASQDDLNQKVSKSGDTMTGDLFIQNTVGKGTLSIRHTPETGNGRIRWEQDRGNGYKPLTEMWSGTNNPENFGISFNYDETGNNACTFELKGIDHVAQLKQPDGSPFNVVDDVDIATKKYVDVDNDTRVKKSGDTMTGTLNTKSIKMDTSSTLGMRTYTGSGSGDDKEYCYMFYDQGGIPGVSTNPIYSLYASNEDDTGIWTGQLDYCVYSNNAYHLVWTGDNAPGANIPINTGSGDQFLSDDGTYKVVPIIGDHNSLTGRDANDAHPIESVTDLRTELDSKLTFSDAYLKTDHIQVSNGAVDGGKPIVLDSDGKIDTSMIDVSTFYYVGSFTPTPGDYTTEYPDTTGENHGAFWVTEGVDDTNGYTFTSDCIECTLKDETIYNGDFMVWGVGGWSIMRSVMNPGLYIKKDKSVAFDNNSNPLIVNGLISNVDDGVSNTDAVNVQQLNDGLSTKSDINHTHSEYVNKSGDTITGNLTVQGNFRSLTDISTTGDISTEMSLNVGFNANGNSAIGFGYDYNTSSLTSSLYHDETDNQFKVDLTTAEEGYTLYHTGNFTPDDKVNVSGDTMTGPLTLTGTREGYLNITSPLDSDAWPKMRFSNNSISQWTDFEYNINSHSWNVYLKDSTSGVEDTQNNFLFTPSGISTMYNISVTDHTAPTEDFHLTRKDYVDNIVNGFLPISGGTITGDLTVNQDLNVGANIDAVGEITSQNLLGTGLNANGNSIIQFNHNNGNNGVIFYDNTVNDFKVDLTTAEEGYTLLHTGNMPQIDSKDFTAIYSPSNGILIKTNVDITTDNSMFLLQIRGNAYGGDATEGNEGPIFTDIQGYSYSDNGTLLNVHAIQMGLEFNIDVFHGDGTNDNLLYFWIQPLSSSQSWYFKFYRTDKMNGDKIYQEQITILDESKPTEIINDTQITPKRYLDTSKSSDFAPVNHNHDSEYVNISGDVMTGDLEINKGNSWKNHLTDYGMEIHSQDDSNEVEIIFDPTTLAVDFKFNTDISFSANYHSAPSTKFQPTDANHLARKDYVDTKEINLGVPSEDGQILSSLKDGTRSWIDYPTGGTWGSITGDINNQTDLMQEFDKKVTYQELDGADLDTITTQSINNIVNAVNSPSNELQGTLIVTTNSNNDTNQLWQTESKIYTRIYKDSNWSSWKTYGAMVFDGEALYIDL